MLDVAPAGIRRHHWQLSDPRSRAFPTASRHACKANQNPEDQHPVRDRAIDHVHHGQENGAGDQGRANRVRRLPGEDLVGTASDIKDSLDFVGGCLEPSKKSGADGCLDDGACLWSKAAV
jgi:hypothetical protein